MKKFRAWVGVPGRILAGIIVFSVSLGLAWIAAAAIDGVTFRTSAPLLLILLLSVLVLELFSRTDRRKS